MKKQSVWSKVGAIALTVLGGFYGLLGLVSYFIRTWDFGIDTFFLLERDGLYQVSPYRGCLPTLEKLGQDYARLEQKGQASPEAEKAVDDILNTWIRSIRNEDTGKQDALSQDIVFTAKALEQKMVMEGEGESPFKGPHHPS